jgi:hypothetical protein
MLMTTRPAALIATGSLALTIACAPANLSTTLSNAADQMKPTGPIEQLWERPKDLASRDLYWGPWGRSLAPKPGEKYKVIAEKTRGFSPGFTLVDSRGQEWSAKQGPEAHTEVVVSRILSALGYHQPPVYYVAEWTQTEGEKSTVQKAGRFRPKDVGLDDKGPWSWYDNPFTGTAAHQGLLALLMVLNSTDLKADNNTVYEVSRRPKGSATVARWYVVRDVGASLGETGKIRPTRGDAEVFAAERFILGVKNGFVELNYRGRHQQLADYLRPQDLGWMVNLASGLTDKQWRDAFRAGGVEGKNADLFITRIHEKLDEARAVAAN